MTSLRAIVRDLSPLVATGAVVVTLVTCVVIAKARDVYVGGLDWPYFSDMGRDPPASYVFCVGLSIIAVTLAISWLFNGHFQRQALKVMGTKAISPATHRASTVAMVVAVASVIGLPILAIFDTSSYPDLHNYAAYYFFLLQTIALIVNTVVTSKIHAAAARVHLTAPDVRGYASDGHPSQPPQLTSVRRTYHIQLVTFVLFIVAFVLYLPLGLSIIKPFKRLTTSECLARRLGVEYCTVKMHYNDVDTKLWNYEGDFAANQLRSAAQLACILTLVGYTLSFKTHGYDAVAEEPGVISATAHAASADRVGDRVFFSRA